MPRLEDLGTTGVRATRLRPEIIIIDWSKNYREKDSQATQDHIAWLKNEIRQDGVKKPVDVVFSGGKVYLDAGYCRLTAAQELRKEKWDGFIDCVPVKGDEANRLAKNIIDNTALPPTVMELGKALQQLMDYGWTLDQVAKIVPPSITTDPAKAIRIAKKALDLNAAPLAVKKAVKEGIGGVKVSEGRAVAEAKKNSLMAAENLTKAAAEAKKKGETTLKREKGAGEATKAKEATAKQVEEWLKKADALADIAMDLTLDRDEVVAAADSYIRARGR
jgi:hypothetical protein